MDFSLITDEPLNYCVYAHVNKQNGKMYVGITNNVKIRWQGNGSSYKHSKKFWNAIEKYGWDNFNHIVLIEGVSREMAHIIECELIKKYDLLELGYNKSPGTWNARNLDTPQPIFQYTLDGEFVQKWDNIHDAILKYGFGIYENLFGKSHSSHNYQWSWTYVNKMSPYKNTHDFVSIKYPKNEITAYNLDGTIYKVFPSYDCLDDIYNRRVVKVLCDEERKYVYEGLIWGYSDNITTEFVNDLIEKHFSELDKNKKSVYKYKVNQYDLDGNYINSYETAYEASVILKCSNGGIDNVCRGLLNVAAGYQWRFSCDNPPKPIQNNGAHKGKPIIQKDINGNIVGFYRSALQAAMKYTTAKVPNSARIIDVCNGKRKTAFNYKWEFITEEEYKKYIALEIDVNQEVKTWRVG